MADAVLCDEIMLNLGDKEMVTVQNPREFAAVLGLNSEWSMRQIKRAMGSLIRRGHMLRIKRPSQYLGDNDQPTTYRFVRSC